MLRKFPFGRRPLNLVLAGTIATALVSNAAAVPAQAQGPTVVDTMGVVSEIVDLDRDALETLEGLIGSPKAHTASADAALSEMAATETAVVLLPTVEDSSAVVLGSASVGARIPDAEVVRTEGAVAVLETEDETFVVAPGASGGVQFINIASQPTQAHSFSMETAIPDGARWQRSEDGGLELVGDAGFLSAYIETPWAVDATGASLPTYFTVVGDVITQHVDTSTAEFPVISDPSIWTVAECIGSVALILGFAAAKMTTLIAKIGKIIKASSSLISKWKAAIGSANFTVAEFKTFINLMHGYLEKTLSAAQRVKVNTLLNAIGNTLVTIIGLEACWNWYKNG